MGKATRFKREFEEKLELDFQNKIKKNYRKIKEELSEPIPHVSEDFKAWEGFFVRNVESFSLKTKSQNRDKQRAEFVRYAFQLYPVPDFMFNAWETAPTPKPIHRYDLRIYKPTGFITLDEYRFWYICIASGGSFHKEYGQYFFTKKESHIFLNCQQDLSIRQAIVYSIAYAKCNNLGKALRISKSKLSILDYRDAFWREVIRFFSCQEPESVEQINDIVDYITDKLREDPTFTIIGKGHTLKSLGRKVEDWHRDLRRLKIIGEATWEGIPVEDKEYKVRAKDFEYDTWKFTQIKSAKELQKEGNRMRHCVLSYKYKCVNGQISIWSVTLNDNKKLTIEVQNSYGRSITQVRGLANRVAKPYEKVIVRNWARDCGFSYSDSSYTY